jgi:hypothetical protein
LILEQVGASKDDAEAEDNDVRSGCGGHVAGGAQQQEGGRRELKGERRMERGDTPRGWVEEDAEKGCDGLRGDGPESDYPTRVLPFFRSHSPPTSPDT